MTSAVTSEERESNHRQREVCGLPPNLVLQQFHCLEEPLCPRGATGQAPRCQLGLLRVPFFSGAAIRTPLRGVERLVWALERPQIVAQSVRLGVDIPGAPS